MSDSHRRSGRSASKLRSTRRAALSGMVVRLVSPLSLLGLSHLYSFTM